MNRLLEEYYTTYFITTRYKKKVSKQKRFLSFLANLGLGIGTPDPTIEEKMCDYLQAHPKDEWQLYKAIEYYLIEFGVQRSKHMMFHQAVFDDVKHVLAK